MTDLQAQPINLRWGEPCYKTKSLLDTKEEGGEQVKVPGGQRPSAQGGASREALQGAKALSAVGTPLDKLTHRAREQGSVAHRHG